MVFNFTTKTLPRENWCENRKISFQLFLQVQFVHVEIYHGTNYLDMYSIYLKKNN